MGGISLISKVVFLFCAFFLNAGVSQASLKSARPNSNSQQTFMEQFRSIRFTLPMDKDPLLENESGKFPVLANIFFEKILNWTPTGIGKVMSQHCDPESLGRRMRNLKNSESVQAQGQLIEKYLKLCSSELATGKDSKIQNLMSSLSMDYDIYSHPFLRRVIINLPGNIRLKGLLGLKGDMKPRPFVVMRLGVFGTIEGFRAERAWLMMLFEQSPFNILVLENISSGDFASRNGHFSFGGYDEGIQNILVAKMLKDPREPISKVVESVHFLGISLGGHGVLFASLLNKYNSSEKDSLIQSTLAFCPVVNLKESMNQLTQGKENSALLDIWSRRRLAGLVSQTPALSKDSGHSFLAKAVSEAVLKFKGGLSFDGSLVKLPPGMHDGADFWAQNNYWKYYHDVDVPVLILATEKDPLVSLELNAQTLDVDKNKGAYKNLSVVKFALGSHCLLSEPYDWKFLATMIQSYILSHSPGFVMQERKMTIELLESELSGLNVKKDQALGPSLGTQPLAASFEIKEPDRAKDFVTLQLKIRRGIRSETFKVMSLTLPLSDFDFHFLNAELKRPERLMIVRWLNQNLQVNIEQQSGKADLKVKWPVVL